MHEHDPNNPFDSRIDAALRTYADPPQVPDPRTVALRLLQQGRELEPPSKSPLWKWAIPVAACLIALTIAALYLLRTPRTPEVARTPAPPKAVAQTKSPAPPRIVARTKTPASAPAHKSPHRILTAESHLLPRLGVFPTPTPLSPQEQALVAFAEHGPPAVQRAVIQDQKAWNDVTTVAGLQPHPLPAANLQDQ